MRYRRNDRKVRREWQWRRGGTVDWSRFHTVAEENMDLFVSDVLSEPCSGWTAKSRYKVFFSYIHEAAEEALGKCYSGHGGKEHNSWWDSEVKESVTKRKRVSKVHRFYKKLSSNFPEVVPARREGRNGRNMLY